MKGVWETYLAHGRDKLRGVLPALFILLVGVVLLLMPESTEPTAGAENSGERQEFDLEAFETKLEHILSCVEGAGPTEVVLTLDTGSRTILAQDQERDRDGGISSQIVTVGRGSGTQEVIALQTMSPSFRGALVVCPGGENPPVRLQLVQAVSALTGLGADQIAISKGDPST